MKGLEMPVRKRELVTEPAYRQTDVPWYQQKPKDSGQYEIPEYWYTVVIRRLEDYISRCDSSSESCVHDSVVQWLQQSSEGYRFLYAMTERELQTHIFTLVHGPAAEWVRSALLDQKPR